MIDLSDGDHSELPTRDNNNIKIVYSDLEIKTEGSLLSEGRIRNDKPNLIASEPKSSVLCCWTLCAPITRKWAQQRNRTLEAKAPLVQVHSPKNAECTPTYFVDGSENCTPIASSHGSSPAVPYKTSDLGARTSFTHKKIQFSRPKNSPKRVPKRVSDSLQGSPSTLTSSATPTILKSNLHEYPGRRSSDLKTANVSEISEDSSKQANYSRVLRSIELGSKNGDRISLSSTGSDSDMRQAIGHCEQRLDRLSERLLCLKNSISNEKTEKSRNEAIIRQTQPNNFNTLETEVTKEEGLTADDFASADFAIIENQIKHISEKLHCIKSHIDTRAYLGWIGLAREPAWDEIAMPGKSAPPPNPQMQLIRRSEQAFRNTVLQYQTLCDDPIPEEVRMELRRSTFNNWPWSDAWLIRFIRQMFMDLDLVEHFEIPDTRLDTWLCDIYRRYNIVPFHNYKHAFMVTQMAYAIIWTAKLTDYLEREELLILITSGICHDLDHPGFNNAYQINANTVLAMRYNDQSPLENHHAAMAFDILETEEANPFDHLQEETYKRIREGIIRCILATDMSRHNDILNQFITVVLSDLDTALSIDQETKRPRWASEKPLRDLTLMIIMKVCDISNEARPLQVSGQWITRLLAEFFHQSDYEKLVGLPVAPFMDRDKVTKAASQCGFIRFVILPLFEALAKLLPQLQDTVVQPAIVQLNYYTAMQTSEVQNATDTHGDEVEANSEDQ